MTPQLLAHLPGNEYFTLLGIDPASVMVGVCAMHVNIATLQIEGCEIQTLNLNKPSGGRSANAWMLDTHSERSARMRELAWMLGGVLQYYMPTAVACEAPFFNPGRPNAYQVLVEAMKTIENTLYHWDPCKPLYRIETSVGKAAIAPSDKSLKETLKTIKDSKEKVEFCVRHHPELSRFVDTARYDEHGIDAAVVAYAQLLRFRAGDFSITF